jgi:hypothetical protein
MPFTRWFPALALGAVFLQGGMAPSAKAANYSDDPTKPTDVRLDRANRRFTFSGHVAGTGLNTTTCGTAAPPINCRDFVKITVPRFWQVTKINLDYYNAVDDRAFVAIQAGDTYAGDLSTGGTSPLAYNHFGWRGLCATSYGALRPTAPSANYNCTNGTDTDPVSTPISTDLFTNVYIGAPANSPVIGAPLGEGDYTFWIQQVTGDSEYTFTATAEYVPGPLPVLGAAGALGWSRRLRRRIKAQKAQ